MNDKSVVTRGLARKFLEGGSKSSKISAIMVGRQNKFGSSNFFFKKKDFIAPFYEWGSTASRLEPLWGGSLLITTKLPEISGTRFYRPRKDERLSWPWSHPLVLNTGPWIRNPASWPLDHWWNGWNGKFRTFFYEISLILILPTLTLDWDSSRTT